MDEPAVSTGPELRESYIVPDEPDQVIAFYERELAADGWKMDPGTVTAVDKKDDGTAAAVLTATFVKDDLQLVLSVVANDKDPERGAAYAHLLIQPR